jgi:organic radical activating enzyme
MDITWEVAYARLSHERMLRTAEALISMRPDSVTLTGGEPLTVPGLFELIELFRAAGIRVVLRTGGVGLHPSMVTTLLGLCDRIEVTAESFAHAVQALHVLNAEAARTAGAEFGLDATCVRHGFDRLEEFCSRTAAELGELSFVMLGDAIAADHAQYLQALAPQRVRVTVTTICTTDAVLRSRRR